MGRESRFDAHERGARLFVAKIQRQDEDVNNVSDCVYYGNVGITVADSTQSTCLVPLHSQYACYRLQQGE